MDCTQMQLCCFRFYKILISYSFIFWIDLSPCISPGLLSVANVTPPPHQFMCLPNCYYQTYDIIGLSLGGQQQCNVHTRLCENWSTCSKVEKADGHACAHTHKHMHREHYEYHTFTFFLEGTENILCMFIFSLLLCVSPRNDRNHNPVTS